jgi:hypothetical protein
VDCIGENEDTNENEVKEVDDLCYDEINLNKVEERLNQNSRFKNDKPIRMIWKMRMWKQHPIAKKVREHPNLATSQNAQMLGEQALGEFPSLLPPTRMNLH